jgi:hypothetical protein
MAGAEQGDQLHVKAGDSKRATAFEHTDVGEYETGGRTRLALEGWSREKDDDYSHIRKTSEELSKEKVNGLVTAIKDYQEHKGNKAEQNEDLDTVAKLARRLSPEERERVNADLEKQKCQFYLTEENHVSDVGLKPERPPKDIGLEPEPVPKEIKLREPSPKYLELPDPPYNN